MADEDQRDAREADVAGGDRREAEREEGSNDSWHEQMDSCICSEGIRFLEAPWRAMNKSPQKPTREATGGASSGAGDGAIPPRWRSATSAARSASSIRIDVAGPKARGSSGCCGSAPVHRSSSMTSRICQFKASKRAYASDLRRRSTAHRQQRAQNRGCTESNLLTAVGVRQAPRTKLC